MHADHFDANVQRITARLTRRSGLRLLTALGLARVVPSPTTGARNRKKKKKACPPCKKRKKGKCKATLPDEAACSGGTCQGGSCSAAPPPPATTPPPGDICPSGTTACGGGCVNLLRDPLHCGGCGRPCPAQAPQTCGTTGRCFEGTCERHVFPTLCQQPFCQGATKAVFESRCKDGKCESVGSVSCLPGRCDSATAQCTLSCSLDGDCAIGFGWCDGGICRRNQDNGTVCDRGAQCSSGFCVGGFCCTTSTCEAGNATGSCATGACTVICNAGWGNCDGSLTNGCEADLQSHPSHCGGCNTPCSGPCGPNNSGTRECVGGSCFCTS